VKAWIKKQKNLPRRCLRATGPRSEQRMLQSDMIQSNIKG
jgi:hypothetical protein